MLGSRDGCEAAEARLRHAPCYIRPHCLAYLALLHALECASRYDLARVVDRALVSFTVLLQCKRYQGSVGSSVIRDFRGAMMAAAIRG